jgi:alpha-galactosidase
MKGKLSRKRVSLFMALLFVMAVTVAQISLDGGRVMALNNGLALTPPMGWNSWNKFGGGATETIVKEIADAMVSSGMKDCGYQYIVLDDWWMASSRDSSGNLVPDATKFPNGMKVVADYVHSKGLKMGLYEDRGTATCCGLPGSHGHEVQDANTFASWGIDYIKYDNCNGDSDIQADYERMRDALAACGRPICYSICCWGFNSWCPADGNLWRTTGDISDNWGSMTSIMDSNAGLAQYAGPGHWNDPDMMEVGNGGMTTIEYQAHFTMWCIMAAPLIAGNDLRNMTQDTINILTNKEAIAVDQDAAGIQGTRVVDDGDKEMWCKPLGSATGGTKAVALLNRSGSAANMTVNWSDIGLSGSATVRDLWAKADRGSFNGSYSVSVPSHGVAFLKITGGGVILTPTPTTRPTSTPTPTPTTRVSTPTSTRRVTPTRRGLTPTPTRRNVATATPTPTRTATPTPIRGNGTGNYVVSYVIQSDWGSGATINVTITNNTMVAVNGWTLAFSFPGNQTITNLWNGTYTQSGASVSVKDVGYNANIPISGGTLNFGFNINYNGTNTKPTAFTLNGTACQIQ